MRLILGATFAAVAAACPAYGEETDETIVVTATRAPSAASRLPARVEVIDRAEIEAQGLATLAEALGNSAVQSGTAGATTSVFLRGANSKHTLALLDGIRLNDPSSPNAQYEFGQDTLGGLERVEVLRAPASSVYGSDALGGVVNVIPRRGAENAFEPFAELIAGELAMRQALIGAAGSTLRTDYGASLEWFETDGFDQIPERITLRTGHPDGARIGAATLVTRTDASPALAFDALLRWRVAENQFDSFSAGPFFAQRGDDPDLEAESVQRVWRLGGDMTAGAVVWRLEGGQVLFESAERDGGVRTADAESAGSFVDATARWSPASWSAFSNAIVTFGASLTRDEADVGGTLFSDPLSEAEDARAAFVVAQSDVAQDWSVTGSARVDDFDGFGAHSTYAFGLVRRFADVRAFANIGTAFKAPSLGERFGTGMFNLGNPDLEPEESQSWEIGADWDAAGWLALGASYYETRIENLIEYDFATLRNLNIGRAEIDGAEAYAALAGPWGSLRLDYAWTDARNGVTGVQLARRPETAWRIEATARPHERVTASLVWSWIGPRADVTYDDQGFFLSGAGRTPGYDVGAAAVSFELRPGAEMFVRVDNVADERYEQPAAFAGAPRNARIGLRLTARGD